ncbi:acetyltransferase [Leptolyngbya sp. FACHB-261]|uniref:acetyltransferase n=1 Tax=Leptolyngbya sp. FACHB-261 TaxID=2692806 RepID=UPI001684DF13|nr:acetyltransferase [Leptolyngbya sp. FACHB-261]MBD2100779.1 acetyltransferase [Leptolyngbya sp. FACHB-261]
MFLQHKESSELVEVVGVTELVNPAQSQVRAKSQSGQEEQDSASFEKSELVFPSGESLPRCWVDPHYKNA